MDDIIFAVIQLVIAIIAFLIGKYIFPNLKKLTDSNNEFVAALSTWVFNFVVDAKNSLKDAEGEEKREWVYAQVSELLDKWGVVLSSEQIYALIESAYDKMLFEQPIVVAESIGFNNVPEDKLDEILETLPEENE